MVPSAGRQGHHARGQLTRGGLIYGTRECPLPSRLYAQHIPTGPRGLTVLKDISAIDAAHQRDGPSSVEQKVYGDSIAGPLGIAGEREWIGQRSPGSRLDGDDLLQATSFALQTRMRFEGAVLIGEEARCACNCGVFDIVGIGQRKWALVGRRCRASTLTEGCGEGVERIGSQG